MSAWSTGGFWKGGNSQFFDLQAAEFLKTHQKVHLRHGHFLFKYMLKLKVKKTA